MCDAVGHQWCTVPRAPARKFQVNLLTARHLPVSAASRHTREPWSVHANAEKCDANILLYLHIEWWVNPKLFELGKKQRSSEACTRLLP